MNAFVGVGRIEDVQSYEKVVKFNLSVLQEKPCIIPCLIFSQNDEAKEFVSNLQILKSIRHLIPKTSGPQFQAFPFEHS